MPDIQDISVERTNIKIAGPGHPGRPVDNTPLGDGQRACLPTHLVYMVAVPEVICDSTV